MNNKGVVRSPYRCTVCAVTYIAKSYSTRARAIPAQSPLTRVTVSPCTAPRGQVIRQWDYCWSFDSRIFCEVWRCRGTNPSWDPMRLPIRPPGLPRKPVRSRREAAIRVDSRVTATLVPHTWLGIHTQDEGGPRSLSTTIPARGPTAIRMIFDD